MQPAILIDCLICELAVLEIALEDSWAADANFASWVRLRFRGVVHLGQVMQLVFDVEARHTDMAGGLLQNLRMEAGSATLGLSIGLDDWATEDVTQKAQDLRRDGC